MKYYVLFNSQTITNCRTQINQRSPEKSKICLQYQRCFTTFGRVGRKKQFFDFGLLISDFYLVRRANCGRGRTLWTGHGGAFWKRGESISLNQHANRCVVVLVRLSEEPLSYRGCFLSPRSAPGPLTRLSLWTGPARSSFLYCSSCTLSSWKEDRS